MIKHVLYEVKGVI